MKSKGRSYVERSSIIWTDEKDKEARIRGRRMAVIGREEERIKNKRTRLENRIWIYYWSDPITRIYTSRLPCKTHTPSPPLVSISRQPHISTPHLSPIRGIENGIHARHNAIADASQATQLSHLN